MAPALVKLVVDLYIYFHVLTSVHSCVAVADKQQARQLCEPDIKCPGLSATSSLDGPSRDTSAVANWLDCFIQATRQAHLGETPLDLNRLSLSHRCKTVHFQNLLELFWTDYHA